VGRPIGGSFDDFVRTRSTALLRSAYLLTTDRHAAEDLLQDTLERVYVRWHRIRDAPEAYARRALVTQAINRWRRRSRRVPEAPLYDGADPPVADHAEVVAARGTVVAALRALPTRQRAAVVLRYLDDLSEADTAAAMGCSAGAVKSHTSRGLAHLRAVLPDASFDPTASPTRSER
jgi:RNA polymerase sigma-70 factor (sigma-E family)